MSRFYNIHFDNLKTQARLRYRIEDTPLAKIWIDHVQRHIELGYTIPPDVQWFYGLSSPEKIQQSWKELGRICQAINDEQLLENALVLEDYESCKNKAQTLNHLHFLFHNTKETKNKHIRSALLAMFNIEIHHLENLLSNQNRQQHTINGCFYLENNSIPIIDISEHLNLVSQWDHFPSNGDLLLGYHTVGKNLFHCWTSNDVELVKKQMTRPQDNISTEVMLAFSTQKTMSPSVIQRIIVSQKQAMKDWVVDNGLTGLVDCDNPWNMVVGSPKLGENVDNLTFDDACTILDIGNVTRVELE